MKKKIALVLLPCLALAGFFVAQAIGAGETTGTNSVCATATTPAHTIADNTKAVYTIKGATATKCATTTFTIPTSTVTSTVTDPGTTSSTTPSTSTDTTPSTTSTTPSTTSTTTSTTPPPPPPTSGVRSVGFWPGWQAPTILDTTPWKSLTMLIIHSDSASSTSPFLDTTVRNMTASNQQTFVTTLHQHGELAEFAIGGSDNEPFDVACSAANRATFVKAVSDEIQKYGYDGVDLDIESPGGFEGTQDFNDCVKAFHDTLKAGPATAAGKPPLITFDSDPTWEQSQTAPIAPYVDQINLMSYGATCANNCSQFAAYIKSYTDLGVPASKLNLGIGLDPGDPVVADETNQCGAIGKFAAGQNGVGVMEWTVQDDYLDNNNTYPCFDALAPYVTGGS